jgi:perosamine synthetase
MPNSVLSTPAAQTKIRIPLSRPHISEEDIQEVVSVLRTPHLALGPKITEFEKQIAAFVGTKHAVAVNSGTSALHLCVRALGIGEGDEVITTPFSFVASSNCLLYEKAVPRFIDIEPKTYSIDPDRIEAAITPKTKAILGVDVFGYIADWYAIKAIAQKHRLHLIEDSCEALGSAYRGKMAGTFADCGTFAFYPNKQITTGEGGMIVTDRDDIAEHARAERNQGRSPVSTWLEHKTLGFNYRLSDINCALGTSQLRQLPDFIQKRQQIVDWYGEHLRTLQDDIVIPMEQEHTLVSWFVYVIRLTDRHGPQERDALLAYLRSQGIGCNNYFPPIHLQPFYREQGYEEGDFPVTEAVSQRTIALPFSTSLSQEEVAEVCTVLKDGFLRLS